MAETISANQESWAISQFKQNLDEINLDKQNPYK